MHQEEPSSASKIVKIALHHTLGLLFTPVTVLFFNFYCLTSPHIFNYIWRYRTTIQARLVSLEI
jgi:hypothetical protein